MPPGDHAAATPLLPRAAAFALAPRARKRLPQVTAVLRIRIHVLVDCFLSHVRPTIQARAPADRLRRPPVSELLFGFPPRSRPFCTHRGQLLRLLRPVAAPTCVPEHLTARRARRPPQQPRYPAEALSPLASSCGLAYALPLSCVRKSPCLLPCLSHGGSVLHRVAFFKTSDVAQASRACDLKFGGKSEVLGEYLTGLEKLENKAKPLFSLENKGFLKRTGGEGGI